MSSPVRRTNPRPRSTANRRLYLGDTSGLRAPGSGPMALPPGTEGAVECPHCKTWVRAVRGGAPRSHSYGGYGVRVAEGRPACEGSGSVDHSAVWGPGDLQTVSERQAREQRLVSVPQLVRKFRVLDWRVRATLADHGVRAVAKLEDSPVKLYRVEPALRALEAEGLIPEQRGRAS